MAKVEKRKGKGVPLLILQGGLLALLACLVLLFLCSALVLWGVFDLSAARQLAIAACALGGFAGCVITVHRVGHHTLPVGLCVGVLLFLLLMVLGVLTTEVFSPGMGQLPLLIACLCAGGLAGLLGKKRKKRRI